MYFFNVKKKRNKSLQELKKKKKGTNTAAGNIKSLSEIREQSGCYLDHNSKWHLFS